MSSPSPITGVVCCVESCYHVPHSLSSFQFSGADVAHLYRAGAITGLCGCNCYYIAAVVTKSNPRMSAVFSRITNVTASPIFYGSSSVFFLFPSGSLLLLSSSSSSSSFVMVFLAHITLHCPSDIFSLTQHIYMCTLSFSKTEPTHSLTHASLNSPGLCLLIYRSTQRITPKKRGSIFLSVLPYVHSPTTNEKRPSWYSFRNRQSL